MADEFNPSVTSSDYDAQIAFWRMVDAILGGEPAVKAAKELYLPKLPKETEDRYKYRLASAPFTNIFGDIARNLASKPFAEDLKMAENTPDRIKQLAENIDGLGRNLHTFAEDVFSAALAKGIDWILVDYTRAKPRPDGKPLTLADEKEQGLRPYWVRLPAESVKAVYSTFINGVEVIYHARIAECSVEIDANLKEVSIERVRILERPLIKDDLGNVTGLADATWALWERRTGSDGKAAWVKIDEGPITIGEIPLVPIILGKRKGGSWIVEPPLRDLAYMQMTAYRREANLEWNAIMNLFAMLVITGIANTDDVGNPVEVETGPHVCLIIPPNQGGTGPAGDAKWIESTGAAAKEAREQLELGRKEMRDLGMQPLAAANLTVTLSNHLTMKASSAIERWALLFKDHLENAWRITAKWLGEKTFEPEVVIHRDFKPDMADGGEQKTILDAVEKNIISRQTGFEELQRYGTIATERTFEEEQELIAGEQEGLEPEEDIDPRTGRPIREPEPA